MSVHGESHIAPPTHFGCPLWISQHCRSKNANIRQNKQKKIPSRCSETYVQNKTECWKAHLVLPSIWWLWLAASTGGETRKGEFQCITISRCGCKWVCDNTVQGEEETKALPLSFFSTLLLSEGWGMGMCFTCYARGGRSPSFILLHHLRLRPFFHMCQK